MNTTVFAEPGREVNKKWCQFFARPTVVFHPVARNKSQDGEANDEAIVRACAVLERSSGASIALLAADAGYLDMARKMLERGKTPLLVIPENSPSVIRRYRRAGVQVFPMKTSHRSFSAVRAILRPDGTGCVKRADPYYGYDIIDEVELCTDFLRDLGYVQAEREYLPHSAAKFWRNNNLGPLPVFPQQLAIKEVCRIASNYGCRKWRRHARGFAMLVPIASTGGQMDKKQKGIYGCSMARQVFRGGGPLMLPDFMVRRALMKLGYLDQDLNADLGEAMLLFANAPENQYALRKQLDALPAASDTALDVQQKLRYALQSHLSSGYWRIAPSDAGVRKLLYEDGLLASKKPASAEVFSAMKKYVALHDLPRMKTYNGCAFRILRALDFTPCRTGTVEFAM